MCFSIRFELFTCSKVKIVQYFDISHNLDHILTLSGPKGFQILHNFYKKVQYSNGHIFANFNSMVPKLVLFDYKFNLVFKNAIKIVKIFSGIGIMSIQRVPSITGHPCPYGPERVKKWPIFFGKLTILNPNVCFLSDLNFLHAQK